VAFIIIVNIINMGILNERIKLGIVQISLKTKKAPGWWLTIL